MVMIIDFHIHYSPEELVRDKLGPGGTPRTIFVNGVPTQMPQRQLFALENHISSMDQAGVDVAVLSSPAGLVNDVKQCHMVNDKLKWVEERFPGRFQGMAHVPPLGGEASFRELERAVFELGYKGVAIPSLIGETELDAPELRAFYRRAEELGLFIFVHPALSSPGNYLDYDLGRSVGREFQLVLAVIRLINGGVLDEFPGLNFIISHLGGGISALMGRIEPYQDKVFWGTVEHPRHGKLPREPFRNYLNKLYFDMGGCFGNINPVKCALVEIASENLLFGTDYPQEMRGGGPIKKFIEQIKELPLSEKQIDGMLGENGRKFLRNV
jgi:predicted TIM-barrel fold metal-dependent hydrolase